MTRIDWYADRAYSVGVDRGVLYLQDEQGIPWNGLSNIVEKPDEGNLNELYLDGEKVVVQRSTGAYSATLQAFAYPLEFERYSGSDLVSSTIYRPFSFAYREGRGDYYRLHLVYNVWATPDDFTFSTLSDDIDPEPFSWTLSAIPQQVYGRTPTSHIIIDSRNTHDWTLLALENQLYGAENIIPHLPTPAEVVDIFETNAILRVVDNGDGTATITGPDEAITDLGDGIFSINWPSVVQLSPILYRLSSL